MRTEKKKKKKEEEEREKIFHMCESIGQQPPRGRCPKRNKMTTKFSITKNLGDVK